MILVLKQELPVCNKYVCVSNLQVYYLPASFWFILLTAWGSCGGPGEKQDRAETRAVHSKSPQQICTFSGRLRKATKGFQTKRQGVICFLEPTLLWQHGDVQGTERGARRSHQQTWAKDMAVGPKQSDLRERGGWKFGAIRPGEPGRRGHWSLRVGGKQKN